MYSSFFHRLEMKWCAQPYHISTRVMESRGFHNIGPYSATTPKYTLALFATIIFFQWRLMLMRQFLYIAIQSIAIFDRLRSFSHFSCEFLACVTGDDYFISSDESVETIELFSKSLRVNKFPWWVTCIKYYLTIFLLRSTFSSVETIKICATPIWLFVLHNSLFRLEGEYFNCSWHLIYSFIFFLSSSCADCFELQNQWVRIPCAHTCMIILRLALPKNTMTMA